MTTLIRPVPSDLSAEVMSLVADYQRGEVAPDEYNRRFAELQAEIDRLAMQDKNHPVTFLTI